MLRGSGGRIGRGGRAAIFAVLAAALIGAAAISAAAAPKGEAEGPLVRVATTGNGSELVKTLPITRSPGANPRVVMSMGPGELPELAFGDRVEVTAEMQVTGNCGHQDPRCRGPIYKYAPDVRGTLILAASENATGGPGTLKISGTEHEECTQRRPDYEHHCVLVFTGAGFTIRDPGRLPCALDACHINLVAHASHPQARSGELITVGGLRPDGAIPQDRGRINVVRYRDASPADFTSTTTEARQKRRIPPDLKRRVVYSKRLEGLEADEQLAVLARYATDISHLRYAVRTSVRLILAESPNATRQGDFVKANASLQGEVSENNGSNCTQDEGTCTALKVGVAEMRSDARGPLYLNLITVLGPKVLKARPEDRVIVRGGGIEVTRFPPSVNG